MTTPIQIYWPKDVPLRATGVYYKSAHKKGYYWVWQKGNKFYWYTLGNNGEQDTEVAASEAAKRWIRGE
jgi:hypothetical protein